MFYTAELRIRAERKVGELLAGSQCRHHILHGSFVDALIISFTHSAPLLLTKMMPIFLTQGAEERGNGYKRAMLVSPFNVLCEAQHFEQSWCVMPCSQNERQSRLPAPSRPLLVREHFIKLTP